MDRVRLGNMLFFVVFPVVGTSEADGADSALTGRGIAATLCGVLGLGRGLFMFNPHPLRICCLATMAPALTSEAVTRARDKLTGSPASPSVPVMNGRDHQISINSANKAGIAPQPRQHFVATTKTSQVIRFSKDLQKKLSESGHLVDSSKPMEHGKAVNLGTITSLSQLYQHHSVLGTSSSTSSTRSHQSDNSICTSVSTVPSSVSYSPASLSLTIAAPKNNGTITTASTSGQQSILSQSDRTASVDPAWCRSRPAISSGESEKSTLKEDLTNSVHLTSKPKMNVSNGFSALMSVAAHSRPSIIPAVSSLGANKLCSFIVGRSNTDKQSTSQLLNSVQRRQKILETRAGRLMCRLRRLECRQAISHTKQQLAGFVEQQQQEMPTCSRPATMDLQTELLHSKSMSTAALVELVHKMQSSQTSLHQHPSASSRNPNEPTKLGEERCAELERVSNHLRSNLSHLQSALDSDATESSSGGESCDELDYDEEWDGKMPRPPM